MRIASEGLGGVGWVRTGGEDLVEPHTARCSEDKPMTTWLHERLLRRPQTKDRALIYLTHQLVRAVAGLLSSPARVALLPCPSATRACIPAPAILARTICSRMLLRGP